jgi:hypothetical protein
MALIENICQTATNADCTQYTITDQTGDYHVTENPGGYGAPNPARTDVALYLIGHKYRESTDDEDITAIINNTDPENVTSWEIANSEDGYYYFDIMAVLIWIDSTTYAIGDLVFFQQVWYKALTVNLNEEPTAVNVNWEIVPDLADELSNPTTASTVRYDMNYTCRVEICYATVVHDSGVICNGCTDCKGQVLQLYMKLDVLFQSMFINMSQDNWAEADKETRLIIGYCSKTNCRVC